MKLEEENISNQDRKKPVKLFGIIMLILLVAAAGVFLIEKLASRPGGLFSSKDGGGSETKTFEENFQKNEIVDETAKMSESASADWWVNSGGLMTVENGVGKTVQGDLSSDSKWYQKYESSNPADTDGGMHPQNIFRLVARSKWKNFRQQAYFKINAINRSESENRNESNGLLLMSRYEDGDNLYYAGVRVDGAAVIKKKYDEDYYTLSEKKIFAGEEYKRDSNPNLLPVREWIGLRSEFRNTDDGDVEIKLYVSKGKNENWKLALTVVDDGRKKFGENILSDEGYAGIRTDFMDVEFSDYKIAEF
ncbi:MAG: hypothetical protein A3J76_00765 [Candidatus Moranbacteria bacterium RBG_13_45_13]|nr:MAG: hypothetical protein A3J76_00765 [Candidatus Moranbacteria bacterium RBG_13_45_13]